MFQENSATDGGLAFRCDCHVHIYARYAVDRLLRSARQLCTDPQEPVGLLLAERFDSEFFQNPPLGILRWDISKVDETCLLATSNTDERVYIFAGRQIATQERLEVLSYLSDTRISDGMSVTATIEAVKSSGGIAALNWAPGKWSGARASIVRKVLDSFSKSDLLLCDTTLRPLGWPEPAPYRDRIVLRGTDPLPMQGQEAEVGRYGAIIPMAQHAPIGSSAMRQALHALSSSPAILGGRPDPFSWAWRMGRFFASGG